MTMSLAQQIVTIALCVLATMATRFIPFLLFSSRRPTPSFIQYLGKVLPAAVFGMLVVYSLKDVSIMGSSHGLPELVATIATTELHLWKRKMLLSIAGGTAVYMILIQLVF